MKKLICIIILLFTCRICSAQTPAWVWSRSAGGVSNDYSNATCTDANGNVYITGTFQSSTITFGSYTLNNTATGSLDIFVVKYDANGNVLWAVKGGGTSDDWAYSIVTDASGHVIITGHYTSSSITFGTTTLTNVSNYTYMNDFFVVKYDSLGTVIWAKSGGGGRNDVSWSVCTDLNNNVFITGEFDSDTMKFGNYTLIKGSNNYYDAFTAKYDAGGNVLWAKSAGGTQAERGWSICSDLGGNAYVTGYFQSSVIFGSDTIVASGNTDMFIFKYSANGNEIWAKRALKPSAGNDVMGTAIISDANANLYLTGFFQYSVAFGGDTLGNAGNRSVFLAKYDSSGNALWGKSPGGTNNDFSQAICGDANGNVYISGYFASSFLNFGGNPVFNANIGYADIYVASYDANGNALWAKSIGNQDNDYGMGICSAGNSVYVTGYYGSFSLDFGGIIITNTGSNDVFLAKLGFPTGIEENNLSVGKIFPNPFLDRLNITASSNTLSEITLYDIASRKLIQQKFINSLSLNTEQLAKGIYIYEVRSKDGLCKKGKVVKD